jgi:hypothetical protein
MKYIFWILVLFSSVAFAQDIPDKYAPGKTTKFQPQYHFNIGSSYSFSPSFGGGMNMYASPSFSMPLSKRVFVEGGIIASTSVLPGISLYETNFPVRNFNSLAIYGSAFYQITPGLTVYGSGIRQIINSRLPLPYSPMNQNTYTIGSTLKLGHNITIGASIHMFENNNFFSPIPYYPARFNSNPFNW